MSNINLYTRSRGTSRVVQRETNDQVELVRARSDIAQVELTKAAALFAQGETDLLSAVAQVVQDVNRVPAAAIYVEPLLRQYGMTIAGVLRRSAQ